jgi:hypothetical protein
MTDPAVGAANGTLAARSRDLVPRLVAALRLALDTVDDGDPRSPFRDAIAKILAGDGA